MFFTSWMIDEDNFSCFFTGSQVLLGCSPWTVCSRQRLLRFHITRNPDTSKSRAVNVLWSNTSCSKIRGLIYHTCICTASVYRNFKYLLLSSLDISYFNFWPNREILNDKNLKAANPSLQLSTLFFFSFFLWGSRV